MQAEVQLFTECVHPYRDHQPKTEGSLLCRFTHFNACVLWECVWEGWALCWLCPDIHPTLYQQRKRGDASDTPSTQIKEGVPRCCGFTWETTNMKIPHPRPQRGGWSVIVSCQTSKVPLTASYLTFSSQWIYFSFFGILATVPLVTKFSSSLPLCVLQANDKCVKMHYRKEDIIPHQEKVTLKTWWTGKCNIIVLVYYSGK